MPLRIVNVGANMTTTARLLAFYAGFAVLRFVASSIRRNAEERRRRGNGKIEDYHNHRRAAPGNPAENDAATAEGGETAGVSKAAIEMLQVLNPLSPHVVLDVRRNEERAGARQRENLFEGSVAILESEVENALQGGGKLKVTPLTTLVFVSDDESVAQRAALRAEGLGFGRCLLLTGKNGGVGLDGGGTSLGRVPPRQIGRDAVALLMRGEVKGLNKQPKNVTLLDLRRPDERRLFGAIPNSKSLPIERLPYALTLDSEAWEAEFGFPKPQSTTLTILQCRTNNRSLWAFQLCSDAGWGRCYVYTDGSYGWRLDRAVKAYSHYNEGDKPPAAEHFDVEAIDTEKGKADLERLGLVRRHTL